MRYFNKMIQILFIGTVQKYTGTTKEVLEKYVYFLGIPKNPSNSPVILTLT